MAQYRRLDLAEDGLADAFEAAARTWPRDGVPTNPPAWLLTSARRRILDRLRAEAVAARTAAGAGGRGRAPGGGATRDAEPPGRDEPVRDERLRLVMLCAHPALSRENAVALTLRMVIGVSTADIARLFLVPQPTMAARLTRSRKSLAGARFEVPTGAALEQRVDRTADVAYLAFTAGYAPPSGPELVRPELAGEADPAGPAAARPAARPGRPRRAARADAAPALAARRADAGRPAGAAARPGPGALARGRDRRGAAAAHAPRDRARHAVPRAGADRGRARHRTASRRDRLAPHRRAVRRAGGARATPPSYDSTGPSPWPRPTVRRPGCGRSTGSTCPATGCPAIRGELLARVGRTEEARAELARAVELCDNLPERAHLQDRLASLG